MSKKFGRVFKVNGFFGDEQVYVSDPKALYHITVKDQYAYEETSQFVESAKLLFGTGLLATLGEHHRRQRKLLNPVFSLANIREMVPMFYRITYELRDAVASLTECGPVELDMLDWMSRTALEFIGQGGLGYSFEPFNANKKNEYSEAARNFFPTAWSLAVPRLFLPFLVKIGTPQMRRWIIERIPNDNVQKMIKIADTLDGTSREIFEAKKTALAQGDEAVKMQVGEGKDIMSVLLRANSQADKEDRLPDSEILGQMNVLIFAAYDTTSSSLSRMLHILAQNQYLQVKIRQEIQSTQHDDDELSYETLMAMPYLDAFVREAFRMYSPFTFLSRTTRKDVVLPLETPVISTRGTSMDAVHIRNNTNVILGLAAANRDPVIWGDDADVFRPERWMDNKSDIEKEKLPGVYSGMMTFLCGGRSCIGFTFAQLEIKIILRVLLRAFKFELSSKEIVWKNSSIQTPTTKGRETSPPHLPLIVSHVK